MMMASLSGNQPAARSRASGPGGYVGTVCTCQGQSEVGKDGGVVY